MERYADRGSRHCDGLSRAQAEPEPCMVARVDLLHGGTRSHPGLSWRRARAWTEPPRYFLAQKELKRSEEHTSELQSLMRISYAVFCLQTKITYSHSNQTALHVTPTHEIKTNIQYYIRHLQQTHMSS